MAAVPVNTPPGRHAGFNLLIGNNLTPHVIISALNQYTTTKTLANPSLVVLDNQVAALQVGDTVPITTGSANILNSATAASNTVFNSITYQNTGIVLSFRPHVRANGDVNLEIDQEISACKNCQTVATGNLTPSFTDRHVKSSIVVPNGQTVLLAGLIQEEQDKARAGIPVLDQIPVLGEAFASNNNNAVIRTELIIFIRPQIIRDGVDASFVAEELRSKIRGDKTGTIAPAWRRDPVPAWAGPMNSAPLRRAGSKTASAGDEIDIGFGGARDGVAASADHIRRLRRHRLLDRDRKPFCRARRFRPPWRRPGAFDARGSGG